MSAANAMIIGYAVVCGDGRTRLFGRTESGMAQATAAAFNTVAQPLVLKRDLDIAMAGYDLAVAQRRHAERFREAA